MMPNVISLCTATGFHVSLFINSVSNPTPTKKKGGNMRVILAVAILLSICSTAFAHGGGTDRNGCHHNWADGTGSYHCH